MESLDACRRPVRSRPGGGLVDEAGEFRRRGSASLARQRDRDRAVTTLAEAGSDPGPGRFLQGPGGGRRKLLRARLDRAAQLGVVEGGRAAAEPDEVLHVPRRPGQGARGYPPDAEPKRPGGVAYRAYGRGPVVR